MNFEDLFKQLKEFKEKQDKQKQRGFNNYNILTTVLKEHDEVRLHSRMIASLLDPSGEHYQSTLFLDKFLEVLTVPNFKIDSKNCSVYREYKNIDVYITDGNKHIILENKVYAKDQPKQIERYVSEITNNGSKDLKLNDILVIYLSLDKEEPSKYSLGDLLIDKGIVKSTRLPEFKWSLTARDFNYKWIEFCKEFPKNIALFKSIHYKNEILDWLEKCKYEVQNITNLNEVFRQYIDVVKMINNQYKDKIMSLSDYIIENKEVYKLAMELKDILPIARRKSISNFFNETVSSLKDELGSEWKIKLEENFLDKKHRVVLKIYKNDWIVDKKNNDVVFGVIFDKDDYYNACFGVVKNNNVNIENITKKFYKELNRLKYDKLKTNEWWLHLECLHNTNEVVDFVEYIQFNKNAKENFIYGIMKLIEIFEEDSNLMTEINSYLNEKDKN